MKKYLLFAIFIFFSAVNAEKMNIVFTSDSNFGQHTCVTIASILKNSLPEDEFHFYIVDQGIKSSDKKNIENLKKLFKPFELDYLSVPESLIKRFNINTDYVVDRLGKLMVYIRLLIPILLPEVDKALYMDADLYIKNSIKDFYNYDISNHYCLGSIALFSILKPETEQYILNYKQPNPGKVTFNNGVVLLNLKKIRSDNIADKLISKANEFAKLREGGNNAFYANEEAVVNNVFGDKTIVFNNLKYNFRCLPHLMDIPSIHYLVNQDTAKSSVIYHFNSKEKPWNTWIRHPHIKEILKDYFAITDLVGYAPKGIQNRITEAIRRWWITL